MLVHVVIQFNSGQSWEFHGVSTHELAEGVFGVQSLAVSRDDWIGVNQNRLVDVSGSPLNTLNGQVSEQTTLLVQFSDEGRASEGIVVTIPGEVLFDNSVQVSPVQASFSNDEGQFTDIKALSAESPVNTGGEHSGGTL